MLCTQERVDGIVPGVPPALAAGEGGVQLGAAKGFEQKIDDVAANGARGFAKISMAADNHCRDFNMMVRHGSEHRKTIEIRHFDIEKQGIEAVCCLLQSCESRTPIGVSRDDMPQQLQAAGNLLYKVCVVIN
jgi:hypothetical protein